MSVTLPSPRKLQILPTSTTLSGHLILSGYKTSKKSKVWGELRGRDLFIFRNQSDDAPEHIINIDPLARTLSLGNRNGTWGISLLSPGNNDVTCTFLYSNSEEHTSWLAALQALASLSRAIFTLKYKANTIVPLDPNTTSSSSLTDSQGHSALNQSQHPSFLLKCQSNPSLPVNPTPPHNSLASQSFVASTIGDSETIFDVLTTLCLSHILFVTREGTSVPPGQVFVQDILSIQECPLNASAEDATSASVFWLVITFLRLGGRQQLALGHENRLVIAQWVAEISQLQKARGDAPGNPAAGAVSSPSQAVTQTTQETPDAGGRPLTRVFKLKGKRIAKGGPRTPSDWRKVFIKIENNSLLYYTSSTSKMPRYTMALSEITCTEQPIWTNQLTKTTKVPLLIRPKEGKPHVFAWKTVEERSQWLAALVPAPVEQVAPVVITEVPEIPSIEEPIIDYQAIADQKYDQKLRAILYLLIPALLLILIINIAIIF